ncbi:MAG TPA: efflux RND transporter periplasmic adaptor subunit, partial [Mariniflexile sp.]
TYEQQGNIMVFKLSKSNKVSSSIIKVKANVNNLYVVESGLKEGEKIVVTGVGKLRNDMEITPQEIAFDSVVKPIEKLFKN